MTPSTVAEDTSLLDTELPARPYPGLRPFDRDEWPIFFGRERMAEEVIADLIEQGLIVVHGDSGCGKSSLIQAGVLPRLEQESARDGRTWRTCSMTPGEAPIWNLARALALLGERNDQEQVLAIRRLLNSGRSAGGEIAKLLNADRTHHVCILVDQFEELFAHAKRSGPSDARLLIELLIGIKLQRPQGIYVVLTMRSEFLGACAGFSGFAEAVNATQYLLPRMEHADLMRAIREPANLFDGQVSRELAETLIEDAGGSQDQLPLIQHGLMLLYSKHVAAARAGAGWKLGLEHYDRKNGGLAALLSDHADRVWESVEPEALAGKGEARAVEDLFRALTDINADGQAIRRPQTLSALIAVTNTDEPQLRRVVDAFRAEGVSFLRPYGSEPLALEARVDIGHEALMRCWTRIAEARDGWLIREFKNGLVWRSLLVQAESFEADATNVLSPATTGERMQWMRRRNSAWCERYAGGWERVSRLIDASVTALEHARQEEEAARAREAEARIRERELAQKTVATRNLRVVVALCLVLAAVALSLAIAADSARKATSDALSKANQAIVAQDRAKQDALQSANAAASASARAAQSAAAEAAAKARSAENELAVAKAQDVLASARDSLDQASNSADPKARQVLQVAQAAIDLQAQALMAAAPKNSLPPRLYLHVSEKDQVSAASTLATELAQLKLNEAALSVIPPAGLQPAHINALRCFRHDECAEAKQLLELINARLNKPKVVFQDLSPTFEHKKGMRPRDYELWFQPGEIVLNH